MDLKKLSETITSYMDYIMKHQDKITAGLPIIRLKGIYKTYNPHYFIFKVLPRLSQNSYRLKRGFPDEVETHLFKATRFVKSYLEFLQELSDRIDDIRTK